jgi:coenzyme F420-reducing hydrogenase delta subunit
MGIGPPGRDGRSQLSRVRQLIQSPPLVPGDLVVMGCVQAVGDMADEFRAMGTRWHPVDCAGNLHTSAVEFCLRAGAAGVLILTCPPRDCTHREGPRWLHARLYQGREAELKERVDRRRIQVAAVTGGDALAAIAALARFREQLAALGRPALEPTESLDAECETATVGDSS